MADDPMTVTFTYEDAVKEYKNFYAPAYELKIGSMEIDETNKPANIQVDGIRVEIAMGDMAGCASFDIINAYDQKNSKFNEEIINALQLGEKVEVSLGYGSALTLVFKGYISSISTSFSTGGLPTLSVYCMDVTGLMRDNERDEQATESKDYIEVVKEMLGASIYTPYLSAEDMKITAQDSSGGGSTTGGEGALSISHSTNDLLYLESLAREIGYEFFVVAGKFYFRPITNKAESPITHLKWGSSLMSFSRELIMRVQVCKVKVIGKGLQTTERIEAEAVATKADSERTKKPGEGTTKIIRDETIRTQADAKKRADAELEELRKKSFGGNCSCIGLPKLVPGRYIDISGLSGELNATYYIRSVSHNLGSGGFTTTFEVGMDR